MKKSPSSGISSDNHETDEVLVARGLLYAQKKIPKDIFQMIHAAGENTVYLEDVRRTVQTGKNLFRVHIGILLKHGFIRRREEPGTRRTILAIGNQITDVLMKELLTPSSEETIPVESATMKNHKIFFLRQRRNARSSIEKSLGVPLTELFSRANKGGKDAGS